MILDSCWTYCQQDLILDSVRHQPHLLMFGGTFEKQYLLIIMYIIMSELYFSVIVH